MANSEKQGEEDLIEWPVSVAVQAREVFYLMQRIPPQHKICNRIILTTRPLLSHPGLVVKGVRFGRPGRETARLYPLGRGVSREVQVSAPHLGGLYYSSI